MKEQHTSDLRNVVDVISRTRGVVGILLFGSLARGNSDEYSDYDLLVLFEDKASMWRSWDELFRAVGNLKMNLHAIPETIDELKEANPVFLHELFTYGKVLYAKFPLEVFPKPVGLDPFCLVLYEMSGLSYRDKMKVSYALYRKGGGGAIGKVGGVKLSEGCVLIPSDASDEIVGILSAFGAGARKLEIHMSQDRYKKLLSQQDQRT